MIEPLIITKKIYRAHKGQNICTNIIPISVKSTESTAIMISPKVPNKFYKVDSNINRKYSNKTASIWQLETINILKTTKIKLLDKIIM